MCASFALNYSATRSLYPLELYAAGQADVPCRMLTVLLMQAARHVPGMDKVAAYAPVANHSVNALVILLLAFFGMLTAVWATGKTMEALGVDRKFSSWTRLLVVIVSFFNLTPAWGLNYTVPYDVPALAFCAVGVWLIVSGRLGWFYPLLCVATLNRETSCFLVLFFVVWTSIQRKDRPHAYRFLTLHAAAMTALWLVAKLAPTHIFHGHAFSASNSLLIQRLIFNAKELFKPQQWPVLVSVCGFTLPLLWLGRRWIRHRAFALATGVTLVCWLGGVVAQGIIVELRVFGEWAAWVCPMLGLMIAHRLQAADIRVTTVVYAASDLTATEELAA
jgi:hypothetical protein